MAKDSGCVPPEKLPPFYRALKKFASAKKQMWSTPGHSGGAALDYSAIGRDIKKFFGPNIWAADISSSAAEMGSILEHEGPAQAAERDAAEIYGADTTFFVLNGTSTANKVVFFTTVAPGDVVLVGRNCHKSIMHAIIMNEAIPIYLRPLGNRYGLIGPVPQSEFRKEAIRAKINESRLIKAKKARKVRLTVLTNSTYDGFLYNADKISAAMADLTHFMHFDEAWFPYGAFHPFYEKRYAMSPFRRRRGLHMPPVFATQSTHKLLFAFSQGSMLHFRQGTGRKTLDMQGLVEAHQMHASTSPFYPMFATLDASAGIMKQNGYRLIDNAIEEAVYFRSYMQRKSARLARRGDWWFKVLQPDVKTRTKSPEQWALKPAQNWHGFDMGADDDILLDPLKVTLLTPGIGGDGKTALFGIPAGVLGKFLRSRGIVPEKTGFYSILFLFAPGTEIRKTDNLIRALSEFKKLYDINAPLFKVFPDLENFYKEYYPPHAGLRDLCEQMHLFQLRHDIVDAASRLHSELPQQAIAPHKAYYGLAEGKSEYVRLDAAPGRISVFMILPYPPGIPLIMPGERFPDARSGMMKFLKMSELFDFIFPGFETEFHGIKKKWEDRRPVYYINVLRRTKRQV
ncbi:MAG: lysine decarboxylase [Elusimicrobiota bacterium]|jgi:arginine decarboxylase|nr:lysine decarboxylase [Elusimicrobiota bacterium]